MQDNPLDSKVMFKPAVFFWENLWKENKSGPRAAVSCFKATK